VERVRWTDERLDDRMSAIDTSFQRVFDEMRADRDSLRTEMCADRDSLRTEMRAGFAEVRSDISALQRQVTQICAGFAVALLGVVAAGIVAAF
jgi:hypothetical protein